MLTPGTANREVIESSLATLLESEDADLPVERAGFVRRLLFPFDLQPPIDRIAALRDYSLDNRSPTFYVKSLIGDPTQDASDDSSASPPFTTESQRDPRSQTEQELDVLWWEGQWSRSEPRDEIFAHVTHSGIVESVLLMERILLDGAGAWAIVISDEGHQFLIGTEQTSRRVLDAWQTNAAAELARYERSISKHPRVNDELRESVLAHARAGQWI